MTLPFTRQGYYPQDDDYYIILDVDPNASQETIATAFKNLAKKYHPDKNNQDEQSRREADIIFRKIRTAYDVLSDPRKRQIYDTVGPEGLKIDGWQLVKKQLTAQEIRDQYLKLSRKEQDESKTISARNSASFTIAIDASGLFSQDDILESDDDEDGDQTFAKSSIESLASIEISSMSALVTVENNLSPNHNLTLTGNLSAKNGTGEGSLVTHYNYEHSPASRIDLSYQFGRGPVLTTGLVHKLSNRTTISAYGYLVVLPNIISPGAKFVLAHRIKKNLVGSITYAEGLIPSVKTTLVYTNSNFDVKTSYELGRDHQVTSIKLGHTFRSGSKMSVALLASTNDGLSIEYAGEASVSKLNSVGAAMSFGHFSGVTLKLRYIRVNQEFNVPIFLSSEVQSAPIFYGTVLPLVAFYLYNRYYLKHEGLR